MTKNTISLRLLTFLQTAATYLQELLQITNIDSLHLTDCVIDDYFEIAKSNTRGFKINERFQKSFMIELLLSIANEQKTFEKNGRQHCLVLL